MCFVTYTKAPARQSNVLDPKCDREVEQATLTQLDNRLIAQPYELSAPIRDHIRQVFARLAHSYVNETLHIFNSGSHCTRMETLPRAMIRFSVHTLKCTLKCFRCAVVARAEKAVEFSNIIKTNKFRENCAPRVFAQLLNLLHSVSARIKQCNTKNYIKSARSVPINPEP